MYEVNYINCYEVVHAISSLWSMINSGFCFVGIISIIQFKQAFYAEEFVHSFISIFSKEILRLSNNLFEQN
jgi:hypothetical protein